MIYVISNILISIGLMFIVNKLPLLRGPKGHLFLLYYFVLVFLLKTYSFHPYLAMFSKFLIVIP